MTTDFIPPQKIPAADSRHLELLRWLEEEIVKLRYSSHPPMFENIRGEQLSIVISKLKQIYNLP